MCNRNPKQLRVIGELLGINDLLHSAISLCEPFGLVFIAEKWRDV